MVFDFYNAITVNKSITSTPTLPQDTSNYGVLHIVDNQVPIVQRTFTADNVSSTNLNTILTNAQTRHACFTITTSLNTTYTGRVLSVSASQTPGADHYQLTLVMQDVDKEAQGSPQVIYTIAR